jgi:hypothetical protein
MAGHLIMLRCKLLRLSPTKMNPEKIVTQKSFNEKEASCKGNPEDFPSLQETEVAYPTHQVLPL